MSKTVSKMKPFCLKINNEIIVFIFENEISELNGFEIESGNSFPFILGTDAWFELKCQNGAKLLSARSHRKEYFNCAVPLDVLKTMESFEHSGGIYV